MRRWKLVIGVVAVVAFSAGSLFAGGGVGLSFGLRLIQTLSVRVDSLQARVDAHDTPSSALASLDAAAMTDSTTAFVAGWAIACKAPTAALRPSLPNGVRAPDYLYYRTAVVVDSIEVPAEPTDRPYRDDVTTALAAHCLAFGGAIPSPAGLEYAINLAPFGTGQHRIQIRVYDDEGRAFTSNDKSVQVLPE